MIVRSVFQNERQQNWYKLEFNSLKMKSFMWFFQTNIYISLSVGGNNVQDIQEFVQFKNLPTTILGVIFLDAIYYPGIEYGDGM